MEEERTIRPCTNFAQEALETVVLQPSRSIGNAFCSDRRRNTSSRSTRTIRVKVLVHLNGNVVVRVPNGAKGTTVPRGAGPSCAPKFRKGLELAGLVRTPSSSPRSALNKDELSGCAGATDCVDGGLHLRRV